MAGKKRKTVFVCQDCGAESAKWMGKCPGCGAWNTLVEEIVPTIQFLADIEKTRFIVGQVICVDGGQSCDGSIESMNFTMEKRQ